MENMNEKHKQFCLEYLKDMNGTRAYKEVYGDVTDNTARTNGSKLLANANISTYLEAKFKEIEDSKIADVEEILKYLTSVVRDEVTEETLQGTGQGKQGISKIKVSNRDRLRAAELLGKRYAIFTDNIDVGGDVGLKLVVDYGDD